MLKKVVVALVACVVSLTAGPALGITYGELDGNRHPAVGAMIRLRPSDNTLRLTCSGSLISPTVFLTASHCTSFVESTGQTDIWVTFDTTFDSRSKLLHGTMHTNPLFNQSQSDSQDIAVIVLDRPVKGITPVDLPPAGLLDQMKADGSLNGTLFTSVGYGTRSRSGLPAESKTPLMASAASPSANSRRSTPRTSVSRRTFMRAAAGRAAATPAARSSWAPVETRRTRW